MKKRTHAAYLSVILALAVFLSFALRDLSQISKEVYRKTMIIERQHNDARACLFRVFQLEDQRHEIAEELSALQDRVLECGRESRVQVDQALRDIEAARASCHRAVQETNEEVEAALEVCEGAKRE